MTTRPKLDWVLWLWWVLDCAIGLPLGAAILVFAIDMGLDFLVFPANRMAYLGLLAIVGAAIGAVLGVAQWLVLLPEIWQAGWWVLATFAGMALGNASIPFVNKLLWKTLGWTDMRLSTFFTREDALMTMAVIATGAAAHGAIVGISQWLALRRSFPRTGWWVLASSLAWAVAVIVGGYVGSVVTDTVYVPQSTGRITVSLWFLGVGELMGLPVTGAVLGIITGLVLAWLLHGSPPTSAQPSGNQQPA